MQTDALAIDVQGLHKTFRIPEHRVMTLKERALHPLRRTRFEAFEVLQPMSFDVKQGEFFGILGRNGSGKSTLLKCLAGIYRADGGTIDIAGLVAPFIELGVGFNPELTAHENVLINAVMMGLSPKEARARFDQIIEFAELEDFTDLKVKNYSSGMQVRLAFSTMIQSRADVMLIDEVLAVGDAAFQQKCFDVFDQLRAEGRTIVLVTHEVDMVSRFCDRAMLIHQHRLELLGDPDRAAQRYLDINFDQTPLNDGSQTPGAVGEMAIPDTWTQTAAGQRTEELPFGEPFEIFCNVDALVDIENPEVRVWIEDGAGTEVFAASTFEFGAQMRDFPRGENFTLRVGLENRLSSGTYYVSAMLTANSPTRRVLGVRNRAARFTVTGGDHVGGLVEIDHSLEWVIPIRETA